MRRVTEKELQRRVAEVCALLDLPCAHPLDGGWLHGEDRPDGAVALDYGGAHVGGPQVHAFASGGSGHVAAPDVFFRAGLDQRRPAREVRLILAGILSGVEAVRAAQDGHGPHDVARWSRERRAVA